MTKLWVYIFMAVILAFGDAIALEDPWHDLRQQYVGQSPPKAKKPVTAKDPWAALRSVYLPFTRHDETIALKTPENRALFSKKFSSRIKPFEPYIQKASITFDIPRAILKSLIMAESGGDPLARARTTSAKGLMQTIDATFKESRKGLQAMDIHIKNDPFDPKASIMAGSWYLNEMVERCIRDGKLTGFNRHDIASWRYPLEYYYAGPGNGIKKANKIYVFSNGEYRIIDKRAYSAKIQKWARILTT